MAQSANDTRHALLELLKKHESLSVGQLAEQLGLHSMSIRQQLIALEKEGYVDYRRVRIPRGRPAHLYRLTEAGEALFPNNYEQFSLALLDGLIRLEGEAKLVEILQAQMEALLEEYREKLKGLPLSKQVGILSNLLNEKGYMVEWDKEGDGFIIREHHCAIGAIADRYPQVCHQELTLMQELFDADVERLCHKAKGDFHCSYKIGVSSKG